MIRLENLFKSFGDKIVINQVSYQFPEGQRIALVGENGAGKSTLLNIMTNLDSADSGTIHIPARAQLGYLPQEPNSRPEASVLEECKQGDENLAQLMRKRAKALKELELNAHQDNLAQYEEIETAFRTHGGYELESNAQSILTGLGFTQKQQKQHPLELSGGWRMRLELAKIFVKNPDFLILDEPTNHLDLPSLVWVEHYLLNFKGTLLFVSHDRDLLNRLSNRTLYLNQGQLYSFNGNYDQFEAAKDLQNKQALAEQEQLQKKKDHLEGFIDRFGAKASKAKQAQSKLKALDKLNKLPTTTKTFDQEKQLNFKLPEPLPSDRILLELKNLSIGYQSTLCDQINLLVEKGHKITIIGANGIGKSTLLKTIIGQVASLKGTLSVSPRTNISYFSQNQLDVLDSNENLLDNVLKHSDIGQKEARQILGGFLFHGDDVFKKAGVLSGGEKNRLGLACILAQQSNFLILDEPSNHLDMRSASCLVEAIKNYKGTVLFVSHDRSLINQVASHIFVMTTDGKSMLFEGSIQDYVHHAAQTGFPNVLEVDTTRTQPKTEEKKKNTSSEHYKELKRNRQKLEKQTDKTHKDLEALQKLNCDYENKLADSQQLSLEEMTTLHKSYEENQNKIADLELLWLEQQEDLEEIAAAIKTLGRS